MNLQEIKLPLQDGTLVPLIFNVVIFIVAILNLWLQKSMLHREFFDRHYCMLLDSDNMLMKKRFFNLYSINEFPFLLMQIFFSMVILVVMFVVLYSLDKKILPPLLVLAVCYVCMQTVKAFLKIAYAIFRGII